MIPQIDNWVKQVVEPAARYYFRQDLVGLKVLASYSCRPMNSVEGAQISEHAYANAVDIGGFRLSNGETISVLRGWNGYGPRAGAFCAGSTTDRATTLRPCLGRTTTAFTANHFHLDLAHHGRDGLMHICK